MYTVYNMLCLLPVMTFQAIRCAEPWIKAESFQDLAIFLSTTLLINKVGLLVSGIQVDKPVVSDLLCARWQHRWQNVLMSSTLTLKQAELKAIWVNQSKQT